MINGLHFYKSWYILYEMYSASGSKAAIEIWSGGCLLADSKLVFYHIEDMKAKQHDTEK